MINNIRCHQWADLPKELLEMIGCRLDSRVDVLRFRSVCATWRSSVPPPCFLTETTPVSVKQPHSALSLARFFPRATDSALPLPHSFSLVTETTVCRLEIQGLDSQKGWLTKVNESTKGKLQLLHPLTLVKATDFHPVTLNLEDVRLVQLAKSLTLKTGFYWASKILLFPITAKLKDPNFSVLAIYDEGKLGYWKNGDDSWTLLDDRIFEYDDITVRNDQYYVVDRLGTVSWIDKSLKVVQYSPPLYGCGARKNLVESGGELYVVDRYLDGERVIPTCDNPNVQQARRYIPRWKGSPTAVDFRVYKLDEEWGWVDVKSLGDHSFVLSRDCSFSFDSRELFGWKGNSIYFTDDVDVGGGLSWDNVRVFRLEDRSIDKLGLLPQYSEMFWPPTVSRPN